MNPLTSNGNSPALASVELCAWCKEDTAGPAASGMVYRCHSCDSVVCSSHFLDSQTTPECIICTLQGFPKKNRSCHYCKNTAKPCKLARDDVWPCNNVGCKFVYHYRHFADGKPFCLACTGQCCCSVPGAHDNDSEGPCVFKGRALLQCASCMDRKAKAKGKRLVQERGMIEYPVPCVNIAGGGGIAGGGHREAAIAGSTQYEYPQLMQSGPGYDHHGGYHFLGQLLHNGVPGMPARPQGNGAPNPQFSIGQHVITEGAGEDGHSDNSPRSDMMGSNPPGGAAFPPQGALPANGKRSATVAGLWHPMYHQQGSQHQGAPMPAATCWPQYQPPLGQAGLPQPGAHVPVALPVDLVSMGQPPRQPYPSSSGPPPRHPYPTHSTYPAPPAGHIVLNYPYAGLSGPQAGGEGSPTAGYHAPHSPQTAQAQARPSQAPLLVKQEPDKQGPDADEQLELDGMAAAQQLATFSGLK